MLVTLKWSSNLTTKENKMADMKLIGSYDDPDYECQECEAKFKLYFQISCDWQKIEFCPFCGVEVDEVIDAMV